MLDSRSFHAASQLQPFAPGNDNYMLAPASVANGALSQEFLHGLHILELVVTTAVAVMSIGQHCPDMGKIAVSLISLQRASDVQKTGPLLEFYPLKMQCGELQSMESETRRTTPIMLSRHDRSDTVNMLHTEPAAKNAGSQEQPIKI